MGHGRRDGRQHTWRARVFVWAFLLVLAILPRASGAFVLHAHDGHGLHVHLVSGLEDQEKSLDRDAFHARHHAHAHGEESHALGQPHPHHGGELFLGLPSEPVRLAVVPEQNLRPVERVASFFADVAHDAVEVHGATVDRVRSPVPRGRVPRSGARALVRTSSALLI